MLNSRIKEEIAAIVGKENMMDKDLDLFTYSYDGSFLPLVPAHKPDLVVKVQTTEQISRLVKVADANRIPVVCRGNASGRTGGSIPVQGGIVLCLEEMNRILELDEDNMMVTVEPGVRTIDLYNFCAERGLFYPPDPASWKFSTIGGNIAENAGGIRAVKYGVTKDYVMGLEVVLADGSILNTGGKALKNVTGYDLTHLLVGSEGTLAIITKATLKLIAMPKIRKTVQAMFDSLEGACETVKDTIRAGNVPAAAEVMDNISIQAVAKARKMEIDAKASACVIFEFDGDNEAGIIDQIDSLEKIARQCGSLDFRVAQTQEESDELWAIRRGMGPAVAALAPNKVGEDISVPRGQFPDVVKRLQEIAKKYGLTLAVFGHAGDGNLHPSILADLSNADEKEKVEKAVSEVFKAALDLGGTLSGEHGIGITKKPYIYDALGPVGVDTMKRIKAALDPNGILNPGKIF
jgi:glycolate oxidase